MFGTEAEYDSDEDEDEDEDNVEVDLTSWGLDAFMPKEKDSKRGKKKQKQLKAFPNPHAEEDVLTRDVNAVRRRPADAHRTRSLGNLDDLALRNAFTTTPSPVDKTRRASIGSPLDLVGMELPQRPFHRASDHPVIDSISQAPPLHSIPFPRSSFPYPDEIADNNSAPPMRRYSNASLGSRYALQVADQQEERPRANSAAISIQLNDNMFALEPPTNASRFDPKAAAHARTMSNASMGSRFFGAQANDAASIHTTGVPTRERKLSAMELLRPKVLVMPSPLQGANPRPAEVGPRGGFHSTTDGQAPLPPGARTGGRRSSMNLSHLEPDVPIPSNSFIPNPRLQLSLSQMTFSNNLRVGGEQDVSYSDVRPQWPRATEDGEQINIEPPQEEAEPVDPNLPPLPPGTRPAGKLYGKSLIDDLEARKQHMRSKQRTFTGDQRPSMMARASASSTSLLDPSSIRNRPNPNRSSSYGTQGVERRQSMMKPLLDFGNDQRHSSAPMPAHTKSVFGVDTLWEREMGKLREIEAAEKIEAERQALLEAQNPSPGNNKGKKKGKGVASPPIVAPPMASPSQEEIPTQRLSALPPTLPAINTIRGPPPVINDDDESDSDSGDEAPRAQPAPAAKWADESDDEKPQVLRTTGVGPRQRLVRKQTDDDSDDEDVPLSRVMSKSPRPRQAESDSDEEKPLSMLLPKALMHGNDEDDDAPLGLRASTAFKGPAKGGDDDDKPLAFHPEQQRRTQYQMLAQQQFQQQQQQQMMMQAQFQNSMFFGNPSNATMSGFFPPPMSMAGPMMTGMGPIPMPMPSPPPIQDPSKAAWMDQWRREVVPGEGSADSPR